jgi:hypothetical protein
MAMCDGCPFRTPGPERDTLLRYIVAAPDESWPCHESDPNGLCLGAECEGRRLFGNKVEDSGRRRG